MEILANIGFLLLNLIVLGLNIKLYTEILKDKSMSDRARRLVNQQPAGQE